jgi:hypothetical protein
MINKVSSDYSSYLSPDDIVHREGIREATPLPVAFSTDKAERDNDNHTKYDKLDCDCKIVETASIESNHKKILSNEASVVASSAREGDRTSSSENTIASSEIKCNGTKRYKFGDITKGVLRRRTEFMQDYLGKEGANNYQFGDISKKVATKITGKDDYQFGDISKTMFSQVCKCTGGKV